MESDSNEMYCSIKEEGGSFFSKLFSKKKNAIKKTTSMVKQRKAPIKVEPKVFL